ncbi:hypothetical protein [Paenibacillus agilis]|uniref:Uncharacterized protein n=1 Tax=Paenibacillus agilis TaxID=3020863 RepID=A0A559ID22_9BACL|nr:hypothetical protein [Paenibacillus agilis]TVX85545.1 hypothetical protein FPZ44_24625 [Paenibacillus agilis]
MKITYNDFIHFCRKFEEANEFEFNEENLIDFIDEKHYRHKNAKYMYDATYRNDNENKLAVTIYLLEDDTIAWELLAHWYDAKEKLDQIYDSMFLIKEKQNQFDSLNNDREQVHQLLLQLEDYLQKADNGEMFHSDILSRIGLRKFIPKHTVLATTWHIDDIRDRFPSSTTDDALYDALSEIEAALSDAAVREGWEVISLLIGAEHDEERK